MKRMKNPLFLLYIRKKLYIIKEKVCKIWLYVKFNIFVLWKTLKLKTFAVNGKQF